MSPELRILYLSQYFPPEMGAPSARVFELSRRWVKNGAIVTVLTGFPNHPTGIIPDEYKGYRFLQEEKDSINIIRTYVYATPNKGFFKRIISYISFAVSSIVLGTRKSGKQDLIIATSPQFFVGIAGYIISRLKRIPFIFEIRDLWPESIVQLGLLKNRVIIKILEWIELFLYKKAAHIISVTDSYVEFLVKKGINRNKISIIKNGVDLDLFQLKGNQEALKKKYNLENKIVVSYIGTLGMSHALDKVCETAQFFEDQNVEFLLVGEGAEKQNLKNIINHTHIKNVKFVDQIPKEKLPEYYELSDIILVTLKALPLFKKVIPSKIFEIMSMGRPIVLGVDGEARNIVEDAEAGIFSKPEDVLDLREKITFMLDNKKRAHYGNNGRKYVEQFYDRNKLADDYLNILKEILI